MQIKIHKINPRAVIPTRGSKDAVGSDLYACMDEALTLMPGETVNIPLGFKTEFEKGYVALIFARSGLASKQGLAPANKVGVIDPDYRGEWKVCLHNHSGNPQIIAANERIAQVIFQKIEIPEFLETEDINETERGTGGFGSTGKL